MCVNVWFFTVRDFWLSAKTKNKNENKKKKKCHGKWDCKNMAMDDSTLFEISPPVETVEQQIETIKKQKEKEFLTKS